MCGGSAHTHTHSYVHTCSAPNDSTIELALLAEHHIFISFNTTAQVVSRSYPHEPQFCENLSRIVFSDAGESMMPEA